MIVIIDNYDSFSYNLYQMVGSFDPDVRVVRNDGVTVGDVRRMNPDGIVISPGPGRPGGAGICIELIRSLGPEIPVLGVCLGHQAVCEAYGGEISYARILMHGKASKVDLDTGCPLFRGLPRTIEAARYHSLAAVRSSLPDTLATVAESDDGEIMAVSHRDLPVYGVQFHPESILTPGGVRIIENFVREASP
ncbi:MAG: aminodeoxychorismate/anthranilate synthase component II [Candidatus Methanomethylophilaceae archaeon]|jgi:anthranilate synthase component 2|nr:aminodeoxychorismate/anthranilate synthase component II [Candidatus Methanomethylophilaceae archaeon]NLF34147.1 aminodeoxychorismate/anthranilate synthase component II [Thermoplasmatales archaeon]